MPEPLTCQSCVHFKPPAGEGESGHCYGVPPQIVTIGKGEDTRTRRTQPETDAAEPACPHHPGHAAWTQQALAERQDDAAAQRVKAVLDGARGVDDPRRGHNCACVRLGIGDGQPGRVRIDLDGGRYVSVLKRCKLCHGTGKVDAVDPHGLVVVRNVGAPPSDLELAGFPAGDYTHLEPREYTAATARWLCGELTDADAETAASRQ